MPYVYYDSRDAVPEVFREKIEEKDGKFAVDLVLKVKLDEFRESNHSLRDQLTQATNIVSKVKEFSGAKDDFDVDAFGNTYKALVQTKKRVDDGELMEKVGLEEALSQRTAAMRGDYETQLRAEKAAANQYKAKAEEADGKYRNSILERAFTDVVLDEKNGLEPKALNDIIRSAALVFKVQDDGTLLPSNGQAPLIGADGVNPMSPKEWATTVLKEKAPYFFKPSGGGGAHPGNGGLNGYSRDQLAKMSPAEKIAAGRQ